MAACSHGVSHLLISAPFSVSPKAVSRKPTRSPYRKFAYQCECSINLLFCCIFKCIFSQKYSLRLYICSARLSISSPTNLIGNQFIFPQVAFQKEQDLHLCRNTKTTTQPEMRFWTVPSSFIVGNFESSLSFTFFSSSSRYPLYWGRMVRMTVETNKTEQWYS